MKKYQSTHASIVVRPLCTLTITGLMSKLYMKGKENSNVTYVAWNLSEIKNYKPTFKKTIPVESKNETIAFAYDNMIKSLFYLTA